MIFKSDKLDYLRCPRKEFFFDNFFRIEQRPSNVGKLNWDLLGFFSFIFSLTWGVLGIKMKSKIMMLLWQIMFMLNILWEILFFVINDLELAEELKKAKSLYTSRALSHEICIGLGPVCRTENDPNKIKVCYF